MIVSTNRAYRTEGKARSLRYKLEIDIRMATVGVTVSSYSPHVFPCGFTSPGVKVKYKKVLTWGTLNGASYRSNTTSESGACAWLLPKKYMLYD